MTLIEQYKESDILKYFKYIILYNYYTHEV